MQHRKTSHEQRLSYGLLASTVISLAAACAAPGDVEDLAEGELESAEQELQLGDTGLWTAFRNLGTGQCMDVNQGGSANGTAITTWECARPAVEQTFKLHLDGTLHVDGSKKCLDVMGGSTANGAGVHLWDCHGGTNQRWTYNDQYQLVGVGSNRCLTAMGTGNGSALQIRDCNPNDWNQKWGRDWVSMLGYGSFQCLTDKGINTGVTLGSCDSGFVDVWTFHPNGQVRDLSGVACLGTTGTGNGSQVQMQWCNGSNEQKWVMLDSGHLGNIAANRCLDVPANVSDWNTPLQVWDCLWNAQQIWVTAP